MGSSVILNWKSLPSKPATVTSNDSSRKRELTLAAGSLCTPGALIHTWASQHAHATLRMFFDARVDAASASELGVSVVLSESTRNIKCRRCGLSLGETHASDTGK
jgi:hypothetical protein